LEFYYWCYYILRYNFQGENIPIYIIGITGGSASGKTTVSERIIKELGKFKIIYILEIFKFVIIN